MFVILSAAKDLAWPRSFANAQDDIVSYFIYLKYKFFLTPGEYLTGKLAPSGHIR